MKESSFRVISLIIAIVSVVFAWKITNPSGIFSFVLFMVLGGIIYGVFHFILNLIFLNK